MTVPTTPTAFCLMVENRLGWNPHAIAREKRKRVYEVVAVEVGKLKRQMDKDPDLTLENLAFTVEWLYRKRQPVETPTAVCWFVKDALKERAEGTKTDDLGTTVEQAIEIEMTHQLEGAEEWIGRLTRSVGKAREEVLAEWTTQRSQLFAVSLP
jgi:hypothetical protein